MWIASKSATLAGPHGRNAASHRGPERLQAYAVAQVWYSTCCIASERSARSLSERFAESSNECRLVQFVAATGALTSCLEPVTRDGDSGTLPAAGCWLLNAEPSSASPASGGAGRGAAAIESDGAAI